MMSKLMAVGVLAGAVAASCRTKPNAEACAFTACGPGFVCDMSTQLCVTPDAGADAAPGGGIFIAAPVGPTVYVNAIVTIQVGLDPGTPAPGTIEILKNGSMLASVSSAPYSSDWDTTTETEGTYQISARTTVAGRTLTANPVTVVVDRKPPTITNQTPLASATNVLLSDPINVVFSEAVDPKTVTASAIGLSTSAGPLPATVTLSSDGLTATLVVTDRSSLTFPAVVTETLAPTIADLAGNPIGAIATWSWTAPRWVTLPSFAGQTPSVAIGADDHPVVAYVNSSGVSLAKYAAGAVWDVSVPSPATGAVTAAQLALDSTGAPVVAWSLGHTFVGRWNGTSWDDSYGNVPDTGMQGAVSGLALDGMDQPVVAWSASLSQMGTPSAFVARWEQGAWLALFSGTAVTTWTPLLRLDSTGAPAVMSLGTNTFGLLRYVGGSWLAVDTSGVQGGAAAVADTFAFDSQDRPVVVSQMGAGPATFRVQYLSTGTWMNLTTSLMSSANVTAINEIHVALDAAGASVIVWSELANNEQNLRVAKFTVSTGWDTGYDPLSGLFGSNTNATGASVVLDKVGAPVVAWYEGSGSGQSSVFMWRANR
jgi:hypothetical protein